MLMEITMSMLQEIYTVPQKLAIQHLMMPRVLGQQVLLRISLTLILHGMMVLMAVTI